MRTLAGLTIVTLMALLLAACGGDDNSEPTEVATTGAGIATEASTGAVATETVEVVTVAVTAEEASVAGESSPVATAVPGGMATPASAELPAGTVGTPPATPVAASPAAVLPATMSGAANATPTLGDVALSGTVVLPGTANESWVMTDDGCVGLGADSDLKAGRQLVVRDAEGAIVGVTALEASGDTDACAWTFSLTVPESPFYAVSIPMVVEHVFTLQEVERGEGKIVLPID